MKTCSSCGRLEAVDHMYWYAMGRLHGRDHAKVITHEELSSVMDDEYCWSSITGFYDGPYGPEYSFGYENCVTRRKSQ